MKKPIQVHAQTHKQILSKTHVWIHVCALHKHIHRHMCTYNHTSKECVHERTRTCYNMQDIHVQTSACIDMHTFAHTGTLA